MSTKSLAPWTAVLLSALALAGGLALFAAKSAAANEVRPVSERVTRLETQQAETTKQLDKMDSKLDRILERVK